MPQEKNPWDIPEWHAVARETSLVRHLIGSGVTAIGRANYADQTGEYYTAFFGLSIGLERLAKLILAADFAITQNGKMPAESIIRRFGHKLTDLINIADSISKNRNLNLRFSRPHNNICHKITTSLDAFADASRGRYANFATLGDPNFSQHEPIQNWWGEVAELILESHYYGKLIQSQVETRAKIIDEIMSPISMTIHFKETGEAMYDILSASTRTGQTKIVQKYGRYYALTIARWLSEIFSEITQLACYTYNIDAFFGAWERLYTYTVDDSFLKTRKIWPLT